MGPRLPGADQLAVQRVGDIQHHRRPIPRPSPRPAARVFERPFGDPPTSGLRRHPPPATERGELAPLQRGAGQHHFSILALPPRRPRAVDARRGAASRARQRAFHRSRCTSLPALEHDQRSWPDKWRGSARSTIALRSSSVSAPPPRAQGGRAAHSAHAAGESAELRNVATSHVPLAATAAARWRWRRPAGADSPPAAGRRAGAAIGPSAQAALTVSLPHRPRAWRTVPRDGGRRAGHQRCTVTSSFEPPPLRRRGSCPCRGAGEHHACRRSNPTPIGVRRFHERPVRTLAPATVGGSVVRKQPATESGRQ
jgi:hypothetical protein